MGTVELKIPKPPVCSVSVPLVRSKFRGVGTTVSTTWVRSLWTATSPSFQRGVFLQEAKVKIMTGCEISEHQEGSSAYLSGSLDKFSQVP